MADDSLPNDRFKRIEEIYHQALERPEAARVAFVAQACGGDADLLREVERLISFDGKAGKFMDSPALDVAARALAKAAERSASMDIVGQTILHYRLTEKVGEGGDGSRLQGARHAPQPSGGY